jgi:arsenate reductase (thioredoxin)
MKTVLFLCTGNSCRSQLAEALVNHSLSDQWQAFSAGSEPAGYVHPMAIRVLDEIGIHHVGESKSVDRFRNQKFDLVITVCDDAAQNCPVWLGSGEKLHIGFSDPGKLVGTEEEILAGFRSTRDQMIHTLLPVVKDR